MDTTYHRALFDPSALGNGSAEMLANTVQVNSEELKEYSDLLGESDIVSICLDHLKSHVTRMGFIIELLYGSSSKKTLVLSATENKSFYDKLLTLCNTIIDHLHAFGFVVIHYCEPNSAQNLADFLADPANADKIKEKSDLLNHGDPSSRLRKKQPTPKIKKPESFEELLLKILESNEEINLKDDFGGYSSPDEEEDTDMELEPPFLDDDESLRMFEGVNKVAGTMTTTSEHLDYLLDKMLGTDQEILGDLRRMSGNQRSRRSKSKQKGQPDEGKTVDFDEWEPTVLNPDSDCDVYFYTFTDKSRVYYVTAKTINGGEKMTSIPNTWVYVLDPPSPEGKVRSKLQKALDRILSTNGYMDRHELRDALNTHVPHVFRSNIKPETLISNPTLRNPVLATPYPVDTNPDFESRVARASGQSATQTPDRAYAKLTTEIDKIEKDLTKKSISRSELALARARRKWNPILGRVSSEQTPDPFALHLKLPPGIEKDNAKYTISGAEDNLEMMETIWRLVSSTFGVPHDLLSNSTSRFSAQISVDEDKVNSRIKSIQFQLSPIIARIWTDVYAPLYADRFTDEIAEFVRKGMVENDMNKIYQLIDKAKNIKLTNDALLEGISEVHQKKIISERTDKTNEVLRRLYTVAEIYQQKARAANTDRQLRSHFRGSPREALLIRRQEQLVELMKKELEVNVQFFDNTRISLDKLNFMLEKKIIPFETFQKLCLRALGLPDEYQATEAQLKVDAKRAAKLAELQGVEKETKKPESGLSGGESKKAESSEKRPSTEEDSASKRQKLNKEKKKEKKKEEDND